MNILLLNWRDPMHPKAGGAEKLNIHILKPLIARGDTVVWYALFHKDLPSEEIYNGIKIIRFGNLITHFLAWPFFFWSGKFGKVDFLIDSIHGIGYFSTVISPFTKKVILICEVAQNIWDEMWSFPINVIGKTLEKLLFIFYRNSSMWTISESTKNDLISFGLHAKNIQVLSMGYDSPNNLTHTDKAKIPTALFVGRLAKMKGIQDAIKAISLVNESYKEKWMLRIVGRGPESYEKELRSMIIEMKLEKSVIFLGFVSEEEKFKEMGEAWVLLVPSSREGWGMIVGEANHVGTLAVGYKSPGLMDSLRYYSKENVLVGKNYQAMAEELKKIKKPKKIISTIKPGWSKLEDEVLQSIKLSH